MDKYIKNKSLEKENYFSFETYRQLMSELSNIKF